MAVNIEILHLSGENSSKKWIQKTVGIKIVSTVHSSHCCMNARMPHISSYVEFHQTNSDSVLSWSFWILWPQHDALQIRMCTIDDMHKDCVWHVLLATYTQKVKSFLKLCMEILRQKSSANGIHLDFKFVQVLRLRKLLTGLITESNVGVTPMLITWIELCIIYKCFYTSPWILPENPSYTHSPRASASSIVSGSFVPRVSGRRKVMAPVPTDRDPMMMEGRGFHIFFWRSIRHGSHMLTSTSYDVMG